jgi:hypothetical protein
MSLSYKIHACLPAPQADPCAGCTCCDCSCVIIPTVCPPNPPPQPPYNVPYTGTEEPLRSNWFNSQSNVAYPFSTNPNWPLNTGANTSEIRMNQEAKTIFTNVNQRKANGTLFSSQFPTFNSYQELIKYKQAQYSQAVYLPKQGINTLYS